MPPLWPCPWPPDRVLIEMGIFPTSRPLHLLSPLLAASFPHVSPVPDPGSLSVISVRSWMSPGTFFLFLSFSLPGLAHSYPLWADWGPHPSVSLLTPTGVEGFTSQEDQELLSRIEKQLKRRFAIGSQVSEHSIIQDFTKQVGLPGVPVGVLRAPCGLVPSHLTLRPVAQQTGPGWGRGSCSSARAHPQCASPCDFLCHVGRRGEVAEVLLESARLPQPSISPFASLPGLCVGGGREGQSQEDEPPSSPGTVLLTP